MSKSFSFLVAAILLTVSCALSAFADPPEPPYLPPDFDSGEFLRVRDVRAQMKGYGLTVFRGLEPEKFEVEVIGIEPPAGSAPTIVARLQGLAITDRAFNYIQGMEGSPVYFDGKLAGCVSGAMGSFGKEAIVQITPIEYMFEAFDPKLPTEATDRGGLLARGEPERGTFAAEPVLSTSGASPQTLKMLEKAFGRSSFQSAGGSRSDFGPSETAPGSAVGIYFCVGDFELGVPATVTYRDGDRILALGSSVLDGVGPTNLFLRESKVEWSVSSLASGFKLQVPGRVIGRVYQDREFGVAGRIGEIPESVPVRVEVKDMATGRSEEFETQIAQNPDYTRTFLSIVVGDALTKVRNFPADTLVRLRFEVEVEDVGLVERENIFFDPTSPGVALSELSQLALILEINKFHPFRVLSLSVEAELETARPVADIQELICDRAQVEPGEAVSLEVVLKPYKAPEESVHLALTVPDHAPSGDVTLTVRGGSQGGPETVSFVSGQGAADLLGLLVPGSQGAETMEQVLAQFTELPRSDDLIAEVVLEEVYPRVRGRTFMHLPDPQSDVLLTDRDSGALMESEVVRVSERTEWIITGQKSIKLKILDTEETP